MNFWVLSGLSLQNVNNMEEFKKEMDLWQEMNDLLISFNIRIAAGNNKLPMRFTYTESYYNKMYIFQLKRWKEVIFRFEEHEEENAFFNEKSFIEICRQLVKIELLFYGISSLKPSREHQLMIKAKDQILRIKEIIEEE